MIKKLHLKSLLLIAALLVGSSSAWATDQTATFDFDTNAGTNFGITGTSSSSSSAGDITQNVSATIDGVTITITPSGATNPNRFWNSSPTLRMYGGTITVSAGTNTLKSIEFTGNSKWDISSVSTGSINGSSPLYTWSPAQNTTPSSVAFTINSNTQIKKMVITYETVGDDPSIAASSVNIGCNATNGNIAYTIDKAPTPAGTLTAAIKGEPTIASFALGTVTASTVPFTCAANSTTTARTATVTLTYTYGNSQTVTKDVTITQAAYAVTAPEFNLATGTYIQGATFTLTSAGNTIYYSTDGNNPTTSSNVYTGPIAMTAGKVVYKAMAVDGNGNQSSVVTRTYTGIEPVTLPFSWGAGTTKATVNSTTGVSQTGLSSDYADDDYKLKFDDDNDNIIIYTDEKPVKVTIGVKMLGGASTSKFSIQESTNGGEFTEVEQLTISGSKDDVVNLETTQAFAATTRVIKLNFIKGSNVGVGPLSISAAPVPVTITSAEYATFCYAPKALDFSNIGIKVYTAKDNMSSVTLSEVTTGKVPANTPVVLYKAGGATINVPVIASADAITATNDLRVSDGTTTLSNAYVLAKPAGEAVGFYPWGGSTLSAGKIYLQGKASYTRDFIGFDDASSISDVKVNTNLNGNYYDLQGRQVAQPTKGLYIVNGKKVVIK